MSLLDTLLNEFLLTTGFEKFADPVYVEGKQAAGHTAGKGKTFVLKENEQGGLTRLERPENTPTTIWERLGVLQQPEPQPVNDFSGFLQNTGQKTFNILKSLGPITGLHGSPYWKEGLDIDLKRGDPVPSPISGTVEFVGPRGGFGNQVRVRGIDGRSYWLSHLEAANVKPGQQVQAGQPIGVGGATGRVIPGPGSDGSHLDLTVQEPSGRLLQAPQVRDLLQTFG